MRLIDTLRTVSDIFSRFLFYTGLTVKTLFGEQSYIPSDRCNDTFGIKIIIIIE